MAIRMNGQEPGNLGPPFRKRQVRFNSSQGFRHDAPFDVRTGKDVPLVNDPRDQVALLRVNEVRKDYLICEGLNPYTEKWMDRVAVAKPYLLQVTPFDGKTIELEDGSTVKYEYDPFAEDYNTRVVTTTDTNGNLVSEITETLSQEYFVQDEEELYQKDLIYAIKATVLSEDGSQAIDNTGLLERNDNGDPIDHEGTVIPASKGFVIEWLDINAGARRWIGPSLVGFFPVELLNSGGEAGDAEEQCSWKYHIRLPGAESILLANEDIIAEPHVYRRPALGAMTKATAGMARYDNDDELVVYWTNEVPEVSVCGAAPASPVSTITVSSAPVVSTEMTTDYLIEVQKGTVLGASIVHKFGRNDVVPNGSWEMISLLSTTTSFLSAATTVRIKAGGDAADDAAGLGAREVTVVGIDSNLNEISEAIATAGASASSATSASFWRVNRAYVSSAGTYGAANTAAITIENSGGGTDLIQIATEEGQSQYGAYTIPSSKTGYLLGAIITTDTSKAADIKLMVREDFNAASAPVQSVRLKNYWDGVTGAFQFQPLSPIKLDALTDVWFEAQGSGAPSEVSVDFEILLIDD